MEACCGARKEEKKPKIKSNDNLVNDSIVVSVSSFLCVLLASRNVICGFASGKLSVETFCAAVANEILNQRRRVSIE